MSEPVAEKGHQTGFPPLGRLWQIPVMIMALVTFAVAAYIARHPVVSPSTVDADFAALRLAYENGNMAAAVVSAERFLKRYPTSKAGSIARFILADGKWTITRSSSTATRGDLEECLSLFLKAPVSELPPAYEAQLLKAQGDIMLRLDTASDAVEAYLALLSKYPSEQGVLPDLATAYTRMKPASPEQAKEVVAKYLSLENLSPGQSQRGYLAKARVELAGKDFAAAAASAQRVLEANPEGETAAEATLVYEQALAGQGDYAGALRVLEQASAQAGGQFEAPLCLARAICLWKTGAADEALRAFEETVFRFPGTSAALSARYLLARFFFESGQIDAARDAIHNLLNGMAAEQVDETEFFDIGDVADLWFAVGRAILEKEGYTAVRGIHSAALRLMPKGEFLFFDATLYLREAEQLENLLPGLPSHQQEAAQAQIRQLCHEAGVIFTSVLETASPKFFSRAQFNAGHAFYKSGDNLLAAPFLRQFVAQNDNNPDVPLALLEEAKALKALGDYEGAIRVCRANAGAHPTNIYAYQAILLQADLYFELGGENVRYGAQAYEDILSDMRFLTSSAQWRSAIFSLGKALYLLGDYKGAVLKLDEALSRFSDDARATETRYYLGLACRQVAFAEPSLREESLVRAATVFARLGATENSYSAAATFLEADCYYDLGDYQKALALYDRAVEAHVDTSDATRALFQMANCYHRLGREREADATYKRALFNLNRGQEAPAPGGDFYRSVAQWRSQGEA